MSNTEEGAVGLSLMQQKALNDAPHIKHITHENAVKYFAGQNYEFISSDLWPAYYANNPPEKVYVLPIYWAQSKKKTVLVGMNAYRNWHYLVSAKFKREFGELVDAQVLGHAPLTKPYTLHIKVYYKNPSCDGSNIVALIEKVFLDALISAGVLPNDTVQWHKGTTWEVVDQDKTSPRCELTITEIITNVRPE